jgi:hypothetical protein
MKLRIKREMINKGLYAALIAAPEKWQVSLWVYPYGGATKRGAWISNFDSLQNAIGWLERNRPPLCAYTIADIWNPGMESKVTVERGLMWLRRKSPVCFDNAVWEIRITPIKTKTK